MSPKRLTAAEIAERLGALPAWSLVDGGLERTFRTTSWKSTLMLVNAIGWAAEAAWRHPDLTVGYARVTVRLTTHDAGGVTGRDIALAARIDALADWRPAADGDLEGPPSDARVLRDG
jgi:4a-hydroxytetrahydrobiopterin dehydratase